MKNKQLLGPDGTFYHGKPMREGDCGGLNASFKIFKEQRTAIINFGTKLTWVGVPPTEALMMAASMRNRIEKEFGLLSYDVSTLPLKVEANKETVIVETYFPSSVDVLVANPEVFLAWAERMEDAAKELGA